MMTMSIPSTELRLLHVHAHPDDESSKGAATTAYYRARGVRVLVATCTGGERGDVLNPKLNTAEVQARLPELRREEMAAAAKILDIEQTWLGFIDSGMGPEVDPDSFAAQDVDQALSLIHISEPTRPY
jgi:mycothiol S-conjugate amidase